MADVRIRREEIKGIDKQRKCDHCHGYNEDAEGTNEQCDGNCDCDDDACEWHES